MEIVAVSYGKLKDMKCCLLWNSTSFVFRLDTHWKFDGILGGWIFLFWIFWNFYFFGRLTFFAILVNQKRKKISTHEVMNVSWTLWTRKQDLSVMLTLSSFVVVFLSPLVCDGRFCLIFQSLWLIVKLVKVSYPLLFLPIKYADWAEPWRLPLLSKSGPEVDNLTRERRRFFISVSQGWRMR